MLFILNIVLLIIFSIMRLFCWIITDKALKHDDNVYELNRLVRYIMNRKHGKLLIYIFGFYGLVTFFIMNIYISNVYPKGLYIITIIILILGPIFILDFIFDLVYYLRYYREVVRNE